MHDNKPEPFPAKDLLWGGEAQLGFPWNVSLFSLALGFCVLCIVAIKNPSGRCQVIFAVSPVPCPVPWTTTVPQQTSLGFNVGSSELPKPVPCAPLC